MKKMIFILFAMALVFGCSTKHLPSSPVKVVKSAPAIRHSSPPQQQVPSFVDERYVKPYMVDGRMYYPMESADGFVEQGVASWYGEPFHGERTSNGEHYDMHAMTAAHKTLPFGTMLKVINLENNRSTIVRVNDRGPFCRERIIDLSHSAAIEIGMTRNGTAPVEITALGRDEDVICHLTGKAKTAIYYTGKFTVQAGCFGDRANAERIKASLDAIVSGAQIAPLDRDGKTLYRVRVGRFASLKQAQEVEQRLVENGFTNIYTVAWDL